MISRGWKDFLFTGKEKRSLIWYLKLEILSLKTMNTLRILKPAFAISYSSHLTPHTSRLLSLSHALCFLLILSSISDLYRNYLGYDLEHSRHILRNLPYLPDILQSFRMDLERNQEIECDNTFLNWCLMAIPGTNCRDIGLLPTDRLAFQNSGEARENRSSLFIH